MAIFKEDEDFSQRLDWTILQNGWTSAYWKIDILAKDIAWFSSENYTVVEFDCTKWTPPQVIHADLKKGLDFPDYYGGNLSAFNDCLYSIEIDNAGFVIVLRNFEYVEKTYGHHLLDILAVNARSKMLFGKKLITLVQVNLPDFEINPVGATPVMWNSKEWLNASRGL